MNCEILYNSGETNGLYPRLSFVTLAIYSESSEKVTIGCLECKGVCPQQEGLERLGKYEKLAIKAHLLKWITLSVIFFSIQFYLWAWSQSCFTENRPPMSKPTATVARKNSLADDRKKPWAEPASEGNHLPLVGTGFNPINLVHLDSSHVGMVTVAAGLGWICGPGGGGLGTWARDPGTCPEQREKKENIFRGFRCSLIKQSRKDRGACMR